MQLELSNRNDNDFSTYENKVQDSKEMSVEEEKKTPDERYRRAESVTDDITK